MESVVNHQLRLAARPVGLPKSTDFELKEEPVGEPDEGQVVVKVEYISLDPAMRGWMNDARSYVPPGGPRRGDARRRSRRGGGLAASRALGR